MISKFLNKGVKQLNLGLVLPNLVQGGGRLGMLRYGYHQDRSKLTEFPEKIQKNVMTPVPIKLAEVTVRSTKEREDYSEKHDRTGHCQGCSKCNDWSRDIDLMTIQEAIREANRCLKCNDAPCQKGCSTSIDIKTFIYNIQNKNWYGAAKVIFSDNPLGLTCGQLCPISELCARNCNVALTEQGAIKINRLQELACRIFKEMGVKQARHPSLKNLPDSYQKPIALIGAGPASLSCATFLGRLGYDNVHIFEKDKVPGGITANEIPQNRAPIEEALWEVEMVKQLGVKFHFGKQLGRDFSLEDLRNQGFEVIFLGIGLQNAKFTEESKKVSEASNFFYSKEFLQGVAQQVKTPDHKIESNSVVKKVGGGGQIKLHGHVVVLGIGDTALDCARSAFRLGAERVTVAFRRGFSDLRANDEIFDPARMEGINFVPYSSPLEYKVSEDGSKVKSVTFDKNLPQNNNAYDLKYKETGQKYDLPCDFLVQSFGCELPRENWAQEIKRSSTLIDINYATHQTKKYDWLFVGGDCIGTKNLVDAVNDGKTASWFIHKQLQEKSGFQVPKKPSLPGFHTEIDHVDLSTEICGVKMSNPFGLASAPPTTSYPMIRRSFEVGYDFAVVKTFGLDKDTVTNISPRIYKSTHDNLRLDPSFGNIELISEKSAQYWVEGSHQIKKDFPNKILIGSLMAGFQKEDWKELIALAKKGSFDLIELNLSCPHGMNEKGMGRACGEDPSIVKQITQWVTEETNIPIIVKITPNYGAAEDLAKAAKAGGAKAVTLTNTYPSLIDAYPDGEPFNSVGGTKLYTPGGSTGGVLRPIALRKCVEVANAVKGIDIFGSGGIISGDHALSFLTYGAKALQICSAVQNLDAATVYYDLETSLRANLYLLSRKDLVAKGWKGQYPPYGFQESLKPDYQQKNQSEIPPITKIIGSHLEHISPIEKMPLQYTVPEINDSKCLQCGRCFLACADSGYQAIEFDGYNTIPRIIEEDCTGCAICHSVCPVENAIKMVPRLTPYTPSRGIQPGPKCPPEHLKAIPPYNSEEHLKKK